MIADISRFSTQVLTLTANNDNRMIAEIHNNKEVLTVIKHVTDSQQGVAKMQPYNSNISAVEKPVQMSYAALCM